MNSLSEKFFNKICGIYSLTQNHTQNKREIYFSLYSTSAFGLSWYL